MEIVKKVVYFFWDQLALALNIHEWGLLKKSLSLLIGILAVVYVSKLIKKRISYQSYQDRWDFNEALNRIVMPVCLWTTCLFIASLIANVTAANGSWYVWWGIVVLTSMALSFLLYFIRDTESDGYSDLKKWAIVPGGLIVITFIAQVIVEMLQPIAQGFSALYLVPILIGGLLLGVYYFRHSDPIDRDIEEWERRDARAEAREASRQAKIDKKRRAKKAKQRVLAEDERKARVTETKKEVSQICMNSNLMIDTNIWMNPEPIYDEFFKFIEEALIDSGKRLDLVPDQYHELVNLKHKTEDEASEVDIRKRKAAQLAIKRIEAFMRKNLLGKTYIESKEKKKGAYSDLHIRSQVLKSVEEEKHVTVFTDDRELGILILDELPEAKRHLVKLPRVDELIGELDGAH